MDWGNLDIDNIYNELIRHNLEKCGFFDKNKISKYLCDCSRKCSKCDDDCSNKKIEKMTPDEYNSYINTTFIEILDKPDKYYRTKKGEIESIKKQIKKNKHIRLSKINATLPIKNDKCLARIWNIGYGCQCSANKNKTNDYCKIHMNQLLDKNTEPYLGNHDPDLDTRPEKRGDNNKECKWKHL